MMPRQPSSTRDRRGATLAVVAVMLVCLLGMIALAVDLGMAFTARSEAQRVADAAALAGGSAFLDLVPSAAAQEARNRAYDYALRNVVRNVRVDSSEVTVQVLTDEKKVRVWISRGGLATWFARVLGIDQVDVSAMAAAQAVEAGEARCLKPFAVPDIWHDVDDDDNPTNRWWDEGEEWIYGTDPGDRYQPFDPTADNNDQATGYGSTWRQDGTNDYGRQIQIKVSDPNTEYQPSPGIFLPWRIPEDPDMEACPASLGGGGGEQGAAVYRRNICSCNQSAVQLGEPYDIEPGNMIGPTDQGVQALIDQDPDAFWDPTMGEHGGVNSEYGLASPRVVKIALFDPTQITGSGMQSIEFNNFALMFLEGQASRRDPVVARFMYFAGGTGTGDGTTTGSLVLYLRLVE